MYIPAIYFHNATTQIKILTEAGKGIKVICAYTSSVSKSACRETTETHLCQPLKSSVVDKVAEQTGKFLTYTWKSHLYSCKTLQSSRKQEMSYYR
jgi:hypothetical protein